MTNSAPDTVIHLSQHSNDIRNYDMNTIKLEQKEKTSQLLWTCLILMFFAIQAVIWTVAISITSNDSSHTVVSGYDEQALNWDEVKRRQIASEALGWSAKIKVDPHGDIRGNRTLTIVLLDKKNKNPIHDAKIRLTAYHRGKAAEAQELSLKPTAPGSYSGTVLVQTSGQWQFTGSAMVKNNEFLFDQQLTIESNRNL